MRNTIDKAETQFKATIALFGASGVGKTTLLTNLIYQLETKSDKGTPGFDILFYNTKTNDDNNDCRPLLIRFIDVGKFDISANKERITDISKLSTMICFVVDVDNIKSTQFFDAFTQIHFDCNSSEIVLVLNKSDKQKLLSLQSECIKQLVTKFNIKTTIEVCSIKRESVNAFGDLIRSKISSLIQDNNEKYSHCEKEFDICPELIYVKKIKKAYGCL